MNELTRNDPSCGALYNAFLGDQNVDEAMSLHIVRGAIPYHDAQLL